jgi:hypothetical protein
MASLEIERVHQYEVFDGSLDSIFVLRAVREKVGFVHNFVIDYANQRAIDVGGRPIATLVGREFTDVYPEAVEMGLLDIFREVVESGKPYEDDDFNYSAQIGGVHSSGWFHMQATRFDDSVIVAFRDVTSQRERDRQWADERREAVAIQRAFIPDELPEFPGLKVGAAYAPASGAQLGGDWFDCFLVDRSVVMIVGDVAGHGIHSAAVMGQLRNAARAYAHEVPIAQQIVTRVNRLLCRVEPNQLASMIVAVWDPLTGMLTRCAAGHPPLLRCRKGETDYLASSPGLLLGTDANYMYQSTEKLLRPGTTIVFYSDGLIESRGHGLDEGMAALREEADSMHELDPQSICDALMVWRMADDSLDDDMCILAARLG